MIAGWIDFDAVHRLIRQQIENLCRYFFPNGKRNGHEWEIGNLAGEPGDSLKIELEGDRAGLWLDFATNQGGTFLDALCGARGLNAIGAAELIGQTLGVNISRNGSNPASAYQSSAKAASGPIDWARDYRPGSKQLEELAAWRGLSLPFCEWLAAHDLVGRDGPHWCFPVHDSTGAIVAIHKRIDKNKWVFEPSLKTLGLALPPFVVGDLAAADNAIGGESQWDIFKSLDVLGIHNGEPIAGIATRGAKNAGLIASLQFSGEFYGLPQNDPPGSLWLEQLKAVRPFRLIVVPAQYHDANDWLKIAGASLEFIAAFKNARPYTRQIPAWLRPKRIDELNPIKPDEILEGIFCFGQIVAVQGASKARKTFFLKQMLFSIANGLPFLGFRTRRTKVLDVDLELQEPFSRERFERIKVELGAGNFDNLRILALRGLTQLLDQSNLELMAEMIGQEAFGMFDLDPIYKLLSTRNENDAAGVSAMLAPFVSIVTNLAATLAYAHHYAKGDQSLREAIDRGSGSGVFARLPDAIFNLTGLVAPNTYRLEIIQRNYPEITPFGVRWENWVFLRDDNLDPTLKRSATGKTQTHRASYIEPLQALTFIGPVEEIPKTEYRERLIRPNQRTGRPFCGARRADEIIKELVDTGQLLESGPRSKRMVRKP